MRFISFITLLFLSTLLPWYVLLVCGVMYMLVWDAYELLVLAACIDAFFGVGTVVPLYTVVTACMLVVITILKPQLLVYSP